MIGCGLQFILCLILIFYIIILLFLKHRANKKRRDELDNYDLFITIAIFFLTIIFVNVCFLIANKNNLLVESVLKYNEAQQMVVSALVASCIAFFQYRIQRAINSKNKKESKQRELFHINEIKSERIKEMKIFSELNAYALNYNLVRSQVIFQSQYDKEPKAKFFIHIYSTNQWECIYPHYFLLDVNKGGIEVKVLDFEDDEYRCEVNSKCIDIYFLDGYDKLNPFFLSPILVDEDKVPIKISVTYNGNDTSYEDKRYSELKFIMDFQLVPSKGYDENGKIGIKIINPHISIQ